MARQQHHDRWRTQWQKAGGELPLFGDDELSRARQLWSACDTQREPDPHAELKFLLGFASVWREIHWVVIWAHKKSTLVGFLSRSYLCMSTGGPTDSE